MADYDSELTFFENRRIQFCKYIFIDILNYYSAEIPQLFNINKKSISYIWLAVICRINNEMYIETLLNFIINSNIYSVDDILKIILIINKTISAADKKNIHIYIGHIIQLYFNYNHLYPFKNFIWFLICINNLLNTQKHILLYRTLYNYFLSRKFIKQVIDHIEYLSVLYKWQKNKPLSSKFSEKDKLIARKIYKMIKHGNYLKDFFKEYLARPIEISQETKRSALDSFDIDISRPKPHKEKLTVSKGHRNSTESSILLTDRNSTESSIPLTDRNSTESSIPLTDRNSSGSKGNKKPIKNDKKKYLKERRIKEEQLKRIFQIQYQSFRQKQNLQEELDRITTTKIKTLRQTSDFNLIKEILKVDILNKWKFLFLMDENTRFFDIDKLKFLHEQIFLIDFMNLFYDEIEKRRNILNPKPTQSEFINTNLHEFIDRIKKSSYLMYYNKFINEYKIVYIKSSKVCIIVIIPMSISFFEDPLQNVISIQYDEKITKDKRIIILYIPSYIHHKSIQYNRKYYHNPFDDYVLLSLKNIFNKYKNFCLTEYEYKGILPSIYLVSQDKYIDWNELTV